MKKFSIIVPVYNSTLTLEDLVSRIKKVFKNKIKQKFEIILVDDGSSDNSWDLLKKLKRNNTELKIVKLMKNYGQHNAILCGLETATGDYLITIDDDLQNPPEEIPKLIKHIQKTEADCVIGKPIKKKHSIFRNLGSYMVGMIYTIIFNKPKSLKMSSFRIITKQVADELLQIKTHNPAIDSMLLSITNNIQNVDVKHNAAESRYNLYKLIKLTIENVVSYSVFPLRFISIIGFCTSIISILIACYIVYQKITKDAYIIGWTSLIVVNLFFLGLVLLTMGVIGEYLIRIVRQVTFQQPYIVREKHL